MRAAAPPVFDTTKLRAGPVAFATRIPNPICENVWAFAINEGGDMAYAVEGAEEVVLMASDGVTRKWTTKVCGAVFVSFAACAHFHQQACLRAEKRKNIPAHAAGAQVAGVHGGNTPGFTRTGDVVVASLNRHTVTLLSRDTGAVLFSFGNKGAALMQFDHPCGVCVARDNAILVADYSNHRIQEIADSGRGPAKQLGKGALRGPVAVALSPAQDAVIVRQQGGSHRVVVLSRADGAVLRALLTAADINNSPGLAVSAAGVVAAGYQTWIQRFAPTTTCGADMPWYERLVEWAGQQVPVLFLSTGLCSDPAWRFLGLSIAEWSLVAFSGMAVLSLVAFLRRP